MVAPITVESVDDAVVALRRLGRQVRPRGGQRWLAQCPAHDDNRHSLSLAEGEQVPLLLHCHAGCSFTDVLAILRGERPAVPLSGHSGGGKRRRSPRPRRPLQWYDYRDEQGRLLYQHGRTPDKEFPFRMPHARRWGLQPGVRRVLYRLPELVQARRGKWVFVVEGEKDADRLAGLGLVATCNDNGAGKWPEGCDEYFRDLNVVILPDNDPPGQAHARMVAKRLQAVAAHVFRIQLPGLPPKGDVSDWLDGGHDLGDLVGACLKAQLWPKSRRRSGRDRARDRVRERDRDRGRGKEREGEPWKISGRWPRGPVRKPGDGFMLTVGAQHTCLSPIFKNRGGYRADPGRRHIWVRRHGQQVVAEAKTGPVFVLQLSRAAYKRFTHRQTYRRRKGERRAWLAVPIADCGVRIAGAGVADQDADLPKGKEGVVVFHIDAAEGGEPVPQTREEVYALIDGLVGKIPKRRKVKGSDDWGKAFRGSRGDGQERTAEAIVRQANVLVAMNEAGGGDRIAPFRGIEQQTVRAIKANSKERPRPLLLGMLRDELLGKRRKSALALLTRLRPKALQLWSRDNIRAAARALEMRLDPHSWCGKTRIAPEEAYLRLIGAGLQLSTTGGGELTLGRFLEWLVPGARGPLWDSAQERREKKVVQNPIAGRARRPMEAGNYAPQPP